MRDLERDEAAIAVTAEGVGAVRADRLYGPDAIGGNCLHCRRQRALREPVEMNGIDGTVRLKVAREIVGIETASVVVMYEEERGAGAGRAKLGKRFVEAVLLTKHARGQPGDGRSLQKHSGGKHSVTGRFDGRHQSGGGERIASQIEEIVEGADRAQLEELFPDGGELLLERTSRRYEGGSSAGVPWRREQS
jgi:hypothetical protein